ncbi:MAG: SMC-Scp complex subunit ScpB [Candidatus Pacebacteria bacterium]|nr:SMC-Scp complex subunit ScpB [Candidatus Paceibacterota bacterium]
MKPSDTLSNVINLLDGRLRLVEAILFASPRPVTVAELRSRLPEDSDIGEILTSLQRHYAGRGVNLVEVAGGWCFRTAIDLSSVIAATAAVPKKLSRAAIEALSIIAYQQPVTRSEIEEIRGVTLNKGTLDVLLEAGWIKPAGRRESPGRPTLWATSQEFLSHFGLAKLSDLPNLEELRAAGLLERRPGISILAMSAEEAADSEFPFEDEE